MDQSSSMSAGMGTNIDKSQTTIESITIVDGNGKKRIVYLADDYRDHNTDASILKAIKIAKGQKFT